MEPVTTSGQAVPRLVAVGDSTSLDPACLLPLAIGVDDSDTPGDMLDALALAPFATGRQSYASTARLGEIRPGTSLLPPRRAPCWEGRAGHAGRAVRAAERSYRRPPPETGTGLYL
jgi:Domain of unknown function (DUF5925)